MPALTRKTQKVFGEALVAAGNVAQFGSLQAGAPAFSNDPDVIQALGNFLNGLNGCVVGNRSPAIEDLNALFFLFARQIAYTLQAGMPEYDVNTTYYLNGFVRIGAVVYVSLANNNLGHDPLTETDYWKPYRDLIAPSGAQARAWVNFNGNTGAIFASFNISGVVRTAAGTYTLSFTAPLADTNYAVVGSCGPSNGGSRSVPAGNNNHVCRDVITTVNQVSVWIPKPDQLFGEDADYVSVLIF